MAARRAAAALLAGVLLLAGCGGAGEDKPKPKPTADAYSKACPKVDRTTAPPTCTELVSGAKGLVLPADTPKLAYVGVNAGGATFLTAGGATLPLEGDVRRKVISSTDYASTVYAATLKKGKVAAVEPWLQVSEEALLNRVFAGRVLTGLISPRTPAGTYDLRAGMPVALLLDAVAKKGAIGARIINAQRKVKVDGACLPSLAVTGNPLTDGFGPQVSISRVPSMHGPFNDELIVTWENTTSGMGEAFYPSVAQVLGAPMPTPWTVAQHGVPDSGPAMQLRFASGKPKRC